MPHNVSIKRIIDVFFPLRNTAVTKGSLWVSAISEPGPMESGCNSVTCANSSAQSWHNSFKFQTPFLSLKKKRKNRKKCVLTSLVICSKRCVLCKCIWVAWGHVMSLAYITEDNNGEMYPIRPWHLTSLYQQTISLCMSDWIYIWTLLIRDIDTRTRVYVLVIIGTGSSTFKIV